MAVLKTADPPYTALEGRTVTGVRRFGKFVSIDADGLYFVFHLAQGGGSATRTTTARPAVRSGPARVPSRPGWRSPASDGRQIGIDLTEAGTKKSLAVYVVADPRRRARHRRPWPGSAGPRRSAGRCSPRSSLPAAHQIKGVLRSQSVIAGIGNAYSDEILHAAKISPFAMANSLDRRSVRDPVRRHPQRPGGGREGGPGKAPGDLKDAKRGGMSVHGRAGQPCPVCGDTVREVSFADTALQYCPTCQTNGKILADRRTSRFLK